MSKTLYIMVALCALFSISRVEAQTISLGERTPRVKKAVWLDEQKPVRLGFTYVEFIHSASPTCRNTASRIYQIVSSLGNMTFVLVSHQTAEELDPWVKAYVGPYAGVVVADNSIRNSYGVNYAPYAVILDSKRRALWFGNPQLLNRSTIEKLTENGKRKTKN